MVAAKQSAHTVCVYRADVRANRNLNRCTYSASIIKRLDRVTAYRAVVETVCRVEPTTGLLRDYITHPAALDVRGPAVGSGSGAGFADDG